MSSNIKTSTLKVRWFVSLAATGLLSLIFGYYLNLIHLDGSQQATLQRGLRYFNQFTQSTFSVNKDFVTKPPKTAVTYVSAQGQIAQDRQQLAHAYQKAKSKQQKAEVLQQARQQFIQATTTLLPYWYGTPWDFNGTSNTPQQGQIACGYYVTTVLEDSGLKIERNQLAQQASENIIKSLTDETHIKRFSKVPLAQFIAAVDNWGEGLYIVGLDTHVGYIWHDGQAIHFIHSTNYPFGGVLSEPAAKSTTLANSKYRVLGKISADDKLIVKWLQQSQVNTKT